MPNIKSAKKRVELTEKSRQRNVAARSKMRTLVKKVLNAVAANNKEAAVAAFKEVEPVLESCSLQGFNPQEQGCSS